jgi:phage tail sheath protein FI
MAAASRYLHGIEVIEVTDGIRPIRTVKSAVIGIIGIAPLADTDAFPRQRAVLLIGDQRKAALLGATGTLKQAIADIYSSANEGPRPARRNILHAAGLERVASPGALCGLRDGPRGVA